MAVTTMRSISSIRKRIIDAFTDIKFTPGDVAHWSPSQNVIYYDEADSPESLVTLLHEIGHAIRGHHDFTQDIELLKMEREAWEQAAELSSDFGISIDETVVEGALDSYRDWLHARSRCPRCQQAGVQQLSGTYRCPLCSTTWQANDARQCGLKRYTTKNKNSLQ